MSTLVKIGIMCGVEPWQLADRKTVSLLSNGKFLQKAQRASGKYNFENKEQAHFRDVFNTNLLDPEI